MLIINYCNDGVFLPDYKIKKFVTDVIEDYFLTDKVDTKISISSESILKYFMLKSNQYGVKNSDINFLWFNKPMNYNIVSTDDPLLIENYNIKYK